jgi:hypothetical protein
MTTEEVAIRPNKAKALKDLGFLNRPAKIPVPCSNKLGSMAYKNSKNKNRTKKEAK